jgi:hypothetical protein
MKSQANLIFKTSTFPQNYTDQFIIERPLIKKITKPLVKIERKDESPIKIEN